MMGGNGMASEGILLTFASQVMEMIQSTVCMVGQSSEGGDELVCKSASQRRGDLAQGLLLHQLRP